MIDRDKKIKRERYIYRRDIQRKIQKTVLKISIKKNHVGISLSVYLIEGTHNFFLCGEGGTKKCER